MAQDAVFCDERVVRAQSFKTEAEKVGDVVVLLGLRNVARLQSEQHQHEPATRFMHAITEAQFGNHGLQGGVLQALDCVEEKMLKAAKNPIALGSRVCETTGWSLMRRASQAAKLSPPAQ
jgi:hypothetical protein